MYGMIGKIKAVASLKKAPFADRIVMGHPNQETLVGELLTRKSLT